MMTDQKAAANEQPELNAIGMPAPKTGQPVEPFHAGKPVGEQQDGPGAAPDRPERDDALPAGSTAARRAGGSGRLTLDEPDADHRGKPAPFASGAAIGSGSGAGGGGTGMIEEPDSDSAGGGGRERGFHASRTASRYGDGRKHGGC